MSNEGPVLSLWRSRITRTGTIDPQELVANPANWRQHPLHQRDALRSLLGSVGWVQGVVVNERSGNMVDGHLRAELAVEDQANEVPVVWVDLSDDEERLVLAALDPIGDLAVANSDALEALLTQIETPSEALQGLLDDLVGSNSTLDYDDEDDATEADFWPYIRVQVSRDTLRAWEQWLPEQAGDSDDERIRSVMGR
jgi:hypothetical protein